MEIDSLRGYGFGQQTPTVDPGQCAPWWTCPTYPLQLMKWALESGKAPIGHNAADMLEEEVDRLMYGQDGNKLELAVKVPPP